MPGSMWGTLTYMSPEQARGEMLDARSDLFSFGAVLYEMVTGQKAFSGTTVSEVLDHIQNHKLAAVASPTLVCPPELECIVRRALEKDREERYQDAAAMGSDLKLLKQALTSPSAGPAISTRRADRMFRWLSAAGLVVLSIASAVFWFGRPHRHGLPELKQRQITANSSENAVVSGAISPDGRYVAYADPKGIHVKLIETGQTRTIPQPEALKDGPVEWFVVSWFPDGSRILANARPLGQRPSVWTVSPANGVLRRIRDDAFAWSVSRDGSSVAFSTNPGILSLYYLWPNYGFGDREVWLMDSNGGHSRELLQVDENTGFADIQFSPDGQLVAYLKFREAHDRLEAAIETRDLRAGPATTVLSETRLQGLRWLPDGRLIYSLAEPDPNGGTCNFWEMPMQLRTGRPAGLARRLTNWAGSYLDSTSASADSKRLVFRRFTPQAGAYFADLGVKGTRITVPRHVTQDEEYAFPTAWTANSKAIIFSAYRNGQWGIFKQSLNEDMTETIVTESPGMNVWAPHISPDGVWVLYLRSPRDAGPSAPAQLIRVPVIGGTPRLVLTGRIHGSHHCARSPSPLCAIGEWTPANQQVIFTTFDPIKGRGRQVARFYTDVDYAWDLSPDGTRIAVLKCLEGQLRLTILALSSQTQREITVPGWSRGQYVYWAADGNGLFVSCSTQRGSVLLQVDLRGNSHLLWKPAMHSDPLWAVPSPDGRRLAIMGSIWNSNMWMIDNF